MSMWRWLRCLFGRHESDGKLYPWSRQIFTAVSFCRHCRASMEIRLSPGEFEARFGPPVGTAKVNTGRRWGEGPCTS